MIPVKSIAIRVVAFLAMLLPAFLNGCAEYAARSDFEQCKERITSIAIVPPVVYYARHRNPLFTWNGWQLGAHDNEFDEGMSDATQRNVEKVARELIGESKYKRVDCAWPSEQDSICGPTLEDLRKDVPDIIEKIGTKYTKKLNVSLGKDCATVGACVGATHLLFILADGYATRAVFNRDWKGQLVDDLLKPAASEEIDPATGLPVPENKIGMRVMLVEAASGSVIFCSMHGEQGHPGSDLGAIRKLLKSQLKPVFQ